jgi:hypothetical protein
MNLIFLVGNARRGIPQRRQNREMEQYGDRSLRSNVIYRLEIFTMKKQKIMKNVFMY